MALRVELHPNGCGVRHNAVYEATMHSEFNLCRLETAALPPCLRPGKDRIFKAIAPACPAERLRLKSLKRLSKSHQGFNYK